METPNEDAIKEAEILNRLLSANVKECWLVSGPDFTGITFSVADAELVINGLHLEKRDADPGYVGDLRDDYTVTKMVGKFVFHPDAIRKELPVDNARSEDSLEARG